MDWITTALAVFSGGMVAYEIITTLIRKFKIAQAIARGFFFIIGVIALLAMTAVPFVPLAGTMSPQLCFGLMARSAR